MFSTILKIPLPSGLMARALARGEFVPTSSGRALPDDIEDQPITPLGTSARPVSDHRMSIGGI